MGEYAVNKKCDSGLSNKTPFSRRSITEKLKIMKEG
jgi:hypothetical protein